MKQILSISIFIALYTSASAQNLEEILESLHKSATYKAILHKSKSQIASNELLGTNEAISLGVSMTHADAKPSKEADGLQYSLGISQNILNPFLSDSRDKSIEEVTSAIKQETKYTLDKIELDVALAYHKACVTKEMKERSLHLYTEQSQRYTQFKKAYELGEISKKDLLFNKLDLSKLKQGTSVYEREYLAELSSLQVLVDSMDISDIECADIAEPKREISLNSVQEHGKIKEVSYQISALKEGYKVIDSSVSSLGYEFTYEQELDTRLYTFGINIPLDSLSEQKEKLKAQHLALASSYVSQKDLLESEIQNYSKIALERLVVLHDEFKVLESEILPLNQELIDLSKSALLEGEGDIMEYLDATRSYALNTIEMLEVKKLYYVELFELYKVADVKYGDKICKN